MGVVMSAVAEYEAMRRAIQANIEAIRNLLNEADELSQAVNAIKDNASLRDQLKVHLESLNKSITNLVDQTNALFEQYINLANSVVVVS